MKRPKEMPYNTQTEQNGLPPFARFAPTVAYTLAPRRIATSKNYVVRKDQKRKKFSFSYVKKKKAVRVFDFGELHNSLPVFNADSRETAFQMLQ